MDFFFWAAPFFDIVMKVIGHDSSLKKAVTDLEFKPEERLLDLGGGTGRLLKFLPEKLEVVILDQSSSMLSRAQKKNTNVPEFKLVEGIAEKIPYSKESFSYVICVDALHHFDDIEQSLSEMYRVLKPGGEIRILDYDPEYWLTKIISFFEKRAGEPAKFWSPANLKQAFEAEDNNTDLKELSGGQFILKVKK